MAQELRRACPRVQCLARADRVRARAGRPRGADERSRVHRGRLPQRAAAHYDAFVSVGMLEHVGLPDYRALGRVIDRSLAERGRGLLHFIGRNRPAPLNPWIRKRIFPGAYPPTLREVFEHVLEPQDSRCSTWKTCGSTTRRRWSTGARGSRRRGRRVAKRCSTRRSCAPGGCIWQARRRRSDRLDAAVPGGVRARGSNAIPWTRVERCAQRRRWTTCDALIVGGGPAGSTCAWQLRAGRPRRRGHGSCDIPARQGLRRLDYSAGD